MIRIVTATEADIPAIQQVAEQSWWATYGTIFTPQFIAEFLANAYNTAALTHSVQNDRSILLVAKANEQVIGFCQLGLGRAEPNEEAELYRIYLLPAHWGSGIGGRLLQRAEDWLRERGGTRYHCFVHSQNIVGQAFYHKQGFVREPTLDVGNEWYLWKAL